MKQIVIAIIALMVICCGEVDAENTSAVVIKPQTTETLKTVEIHLDDLTFDEAFSVEHRGKGEGFTFWWRGAEYTTDLAETLDDFVQYHANIETQKMGWVLNNDDPDDYCYWNRRDECGVCNGAGKTTWWRDKDGDGLGDHREPITTCYNPNVEDLREYSGDLGVLEE